MRKAIFSIILILFILTPSSSIFALDTDYRFTGQEFDPSSGLYNYGQRYYEPDVGRFNRPDPILKNLHDPQKLRQQTGKDLEDILSNPQSLNEYNYVQNNPIRYVDPDGEYATPWDYSTDIFFFNQSLTDYQENKTWGNSFALAADTIGLTLPIIPAGTGGLFKGFSKGLNYLTDIYKEIRIFNKAEKLRKVYGIANFANRGQLLENYYKHKGSLGEISLKEFSNKAQDLYRRFLNKEKNVLSGVKGNDTLLFDVQTSEFSVITQDKVIKTYFIPDVKDKLKYFERNIE